MCHIPLLGRRDCTVLSCQLSTAPPKSVDILSEKVLEKMFLHVHGGAPAWLSRVRARGGVQLRRWCGGACRAPPQQRGRQQQQQQ